MEKYIIGINVIGYETINVWDKPNISGDTIIIVLSEEIESLSSMYTYVKDTIIRKNNVILIGVEKTQQFSVLATLMVSLGVNNVYIVDDVDNITIAYLEAVEKRNPTYVEVAQYIGGEIIAYNKIVEVLMQIENIIADCKIDTLVSYVNDNYETIDNMTVALDFMKKQADLTNSAELIEQINTISRQLKETSENLDVTKADIEQYIKKDAENTNAVSKLESDKKELMNKINMLEEQLKAGTSVMTYYNEINLSYIKHKIQRVLYFKELTYVIGTASLVSAIETLLGGARKMRVKTVIYDNATDIYETYVDRGIKVIGSSNMSANREALTGKSTCVITEPNQAITNEIVTAPDGFDILIVYDKMRKYTDVISGNNVTKIYVTPSRAEIESLRKKIDITISDMILTKSNSDIYKIEDIPNKKNIFNIVNVDGYSAQTESAKASKYIKMASADNEKIMDKIFRASNISALFN